MGAEFDLRTALLAVGGVVAAITGLFKLSGMKAEVHEKWNDRIDVAEAGLEELAVARLRDLREQINDHFDSSDNFDPGKVIENPSILLNLVKRFIGHIKTRDKLRRYFHIMIKAVPVMFWSLVVFLLCSVGLAIDFFHPWAHPFARQAQVYGLITAIATATAAMVAFISSQYLLADADVVQREGQRDR